MKALTRRGFIKTTAVASMGLFFDGKKVLGANSDIRVAVIGFRSKGRHHIEIFRGLPGVRVVALCDLDKEVLDRETARFKERNEKVYSCMDPREIIDRKDVDAIVIATSNHWHALLTIWACQAGKDVYVEKPVSHNIWEGRQMVRAARKYDRIVQAGTQLRSDAGLAEAVAYVQEGNLGKIQWMRALQYRRREPIGKRRPYFPAWLDYDLWCGPAPVVPLRRDHLQYDWHWAWNTGNGDLGNLGIHRLDVCRWFANYDALPASVISMGGRYQFDDAGETPNTQLTILDYSPAPIIIENRNLPSKKDSPVMDAYRGIRIGIVVQCQHGYIAGGWAYDNDGQKIKQFILDGGGSHQQNFIDAMRSRNRSELAAEILEGHISSAGCHLGNISYRMGAPATIDDMKEAAAPFTDAVTSVESLEQHTRMNEIGSPVLLGKRLEIDLEKERIIDNRQANELTRRDYRKPYVVPKKV